MFPLCELGKLRLSHQTSIFSFIECNTCYWVNISLVSYLPLLFSMLQSQSNLQNWAAKKQNECEDSIFKVLTESLQPWDQFKLHDMAHSPSVISPFLISPLTPSIAQLRGTLTYMLFPSIFRYSYTTETLYSLSPSPWSRFLLTFQDST